MRGTVLRLAAVPLLAGALGACASYDRPPASSAPASATPALWPVARDTRAISSGYGAPRGRRGDFHRGVDITAPRGTPVIAAASGVVEIAKSGGAYGHYIILDHGNGYRTLYAHLLDFTVRPGERVRGGQQIARVGKSGNATGYHLHYEVHRGGRTVDPRAYLP